MVTNEHYDRCGTIADWLICHLTGSTDVQMTHQMAASFGCFHVKKGEWIHELKEKIDPSIQLPTIVKVGTCVGLLRDNEKVWRQFKTDVKIYAALGDLQCTFAFHARPDTAGLFHFGGARFGQFSNFSTEHGNIDAARFCASLPYVRERGLQ